MPRLEDTKLMILFDMARKLREKAGAEALLSLPDVQTPADVAALIWEKSDFYMTMFDEPEAVKEVIGMVRAFMFDFFDRWFKEFGAEGMAHYPDYYMPGGITVSEDEIGIVSSEMYRNFFEEDLVLLSGRYGGIGIHCCADSRHQWDELKRVPGLRLINLHRNPEETYESFRVFGGLCAMLPMPDGKVDFDYLDGSEKFHLCDGRYYPQTLDDAKRLVDIFYQKYPYMERLAAEAEQ